MFNILCCSDVMISSFYSFCREKCGTNSLLELMQDAKDRNITLECIDQPEYESYCLHIYEHIHSYTYINI